MTLLLIDANSIIHRSFHALPPFTAPDGRATGALYGLSSILLKLWREDKPDYAAALFDRPEPTFRKKKFKEYKAQRPKAPDELISQIIEAHNLFPKFGVKTFEKAGFEADDLIATLATKFSSGGSTSFGAAQDKSLTAGGEDDLKVVILTGDMDTLQLVKDGKIAVRTFRKGVSDTMTYDEKAVYERYGLKPGQLIDYKALVGDPSDNIKGVPGVGPKTAADLLQRFGTLENIYNNLAEDPKLEKRLGPFKKEAELSKELVILEKNVPVDIGDVGDLAVDYSDEPLADYFKKMGFDSLVKRLRDGGAAASVVRAGAVVRKRSQALDFGSAPVSSKEKASVDEDKNVLFAGYPGSYAPYSKDFLSGKVKTGFGLKNLLKNLWEKEKDLTPPYFDLGVAFWLLDPDLKNYEPINVCRKFLKKDWSGSADLAEAHYFSKEKLEKYNLAKISAEIEMPLLRILAEMEAEGVGVSKEKLRTLGTKIQSELDDTIKEIYRVAGEEFNINSPRQVSRILFEKLAISGPSAKTKTGLRSTKASGLEELRGKHRIVDLILEYRENFKILSTYVLPLQKLTDADGRLRTEFVQTGTGTGRLSSKEPNLQNIPQESKWSEELRSAFEAVPGWSFVSLDYSQLQLRILAALSEDPNMISAFRKGLDIHQLTASKVLRIPMDKISASDRRLAKTLNFGLIYGMGVSAFARTSGLAKERAREFMEAYFKEFKNVRVWQEKIKNEARTNGYVQTLTGRRRYFFEMASAAPRFVSEAERAAINHPVQGLEADFIKMSMIKAKSALEEERTWGKTAKMILSIHDELLFEVRDDMIEKTAGIVGKIMEEIYPLSVPLAVEVAFGKDWGHLRKIKSVP